MRPGALHDADVQRDRAQTEPSVADVPQPHLLHQLQLAARRRQVHDHRSDAGQFLEARDVAGPGNDERIETPKVQIDDQLGSLWAYFTLTRGGETKIDSCGVNLFLLRKGPDGWKVFQIANTRRTEGCRAIAK